MVVHPSNASFTYAAVLATCRLQELACRTCVPRVVYYPVVRVESHLRRMVEFVYVGPTVPSRAKMGEYVG